MNKKLLEEIVKHVFANLAVIPSNFVNIDKSKSIMNKEFLLSKILSFELEGNSVERKIWGCQISSDQKELKMLLTDCWQEKDIPELYLVIQLKDAPAYGVQLTYEPNPTSFEIQSDTMIACSVNNKDWMVCNTYLQATFLAGMEQLKDLGLKWNKCQDYSKQYDLLLSFIKYHDSCYADESEA